MFRFGLMGCAFKHTPETILNVLSGFFYFSLKFPWKREFLFKVSNKIKVKKPFKTYFSLKRCTLLREKLVALGPELVKMAEWDQSQFWRCM